MTLSLANNKLLIEIPDGFFEGMKRLATLDLRNTGIYSLPKSLSSLHNCLRSLYLDKCIRLQDISVIGNLKALEILNLKGTGISRLPEEISELTNLTILNLSYTKNLKCIPPNMISSLSSLEELHMSESFSQWQYDSKYLASLVEVASLTNLTSLHLDCINNAKWLSTEISRCGWEKLAKFYIKFGDCNVPFGYLLKYKRYVSLRTTSDSFPVAEWVKVLMERTFESCLEKCEGLNSVSELNLKGRFYNLKYLGIQYCGEMEYVVNVEEQVPGTVFPNLENLELVLLPKLKAIWNGPVLKRSFENLKVKHIMGCYELVSILPCWLWTRLKDLEEIHVEYCLVIKEVYESDGFEEGSASILNLKSIKLDYLPSVTSIWKGAVPLIRLQNLKILHVKEMVDEGGICTKIPTIGGVYCRQMPPIQKTNSKGG
ncbi:hypothetical protein GIB67_002804 [Kingdonia uniflora]|uniref:Uncharacterized protein n=1 Tax=Kingdonia uniflora TaxID=39325 RepID=A0A7J7M5A8_9MAGN|nr:hypothetical protein GIB67_002804 [Kingdonia uniflora]